MCVVIWKCARSMAERRHVRGVVKTFRERGTFARAAPLASKGKDKSEKGAPATDSPSGTEKKKESATVEEDVEKPKSFLDKISLAVFEGIPLHYPLRKKVKIAKLNFPIGIGWDFFQLALAFVACAVYVMSQHKINYQTAVFLQNVDVITTQIFLLDFFLNWYFLILP